MSRIFLVIKGKLADAVSEAMARHVDIQIDGASLAQTEIYAYAVIGDKPKVVKWFVEGASYGKAQAAEPGELLWYSERP